MIINCSEGLLWSMEKEKFDKHKKSGFYDQALGSLFTMQEADV